MSIIKSNQHKRQTTISKHLAISVTVASMLACLLFSIPVHARTNTNKGNVYQNKYAAYILDAETGIILYSRNKNKSLHPASLTKLMTLLMVFDALDRNNLELSSRVRISKHAASMVPSKLNLPVGSSIKVEDAIYSLVTKSANDVAVALAEKLGGSEKKFSAMMNRKARAIGMRSTRFRNASGLHDPRQVSTAKDMATLARTLVTKYKKHYHYFSTDKFTYQGKTYRSHNKLMKTYDGMDGMKTGYIKPSGFNLVASAVQNDRRLIGVIFGGRTGKSRNAQMKMLLDKAFSKINGIYIAKKDIPVPQHKPTSSIRVASNDNNDKKIDGIPNNLGRDRKYKKVDLASLAHQTEILGTITKSLPILQEEADEPTYSRWNMLDSSLENSMFNRMIGEGDYDITVRNRIETGLIAISAQLRNEATKGEQIAQSNPALAVSKIEPSAATTTPPNGGWAIQIGAFTTRERTEKAITRSINALPASLRISNRSVAPLKTDQGWIYRGRLKGFTKKSANKACRVLPDCIPVSPNSQ